MQMVLSLYSVREATLSALHETSKFIIDWYYGCWQKLLAGNILPPHYIMQEYDIVSELINYDCETMGNMFTCL